MRLLTRVTRSGSTESSLTLEEYVGNDCPSYAILSHCWGSPQDEVSYAELLSPSPAVRAKSGYRKIWSCMLKAEEDGFTYIWVDTCCINKDSSAELSEGINSMFSWYQNATVCYAYLEDVRSSYEDPHAISSLFHYSRWFTRGWTLQELIAPPSVVFVAKNWAEIGTKASITALVEEITGIDKTVLLNKGFEKVSIAERMSWASNRRTTRVEDQAYSLLGLFNINMPTIYGEGTAAFWRLQNEILKVSNDQTIFTWHVNPWQGGYSDCIVSRMLAPTPEVFDKSWRLTPLLPEQFCQRFEIKHLNPVHQMTNIGFKISLPVLHIDSLSLLNDLLAGYPRQTDWKKRVGFTVAALACENEPRNLRSASSATCMILKPCNTQVKQYERYSWEGRATFELDIQNVKPEQWRYEELYVIDVMNSLGRDPGRGEVPALKIWNFLNFLPTHRFEMVAKSPSENFHSNSVVSYLFEWREKTPAIVFRLVDTGELFIAAFSPAVRESVHCWCHLTEWTDESQDIESALRLYTNCMVCEEISETSVDFATIQSRRASGLRIVLTIRPTAHRDENFTVRIRLYNYDSEVARKSNPFR